MSTPTHEVAPAPGGLGFFRDLRVLELGTWMAAPSAGAMLADLGADVLKIEPPTGDPGRAYFTSIGTDIKESPTFTLDNRRKRSAVLDLRDPGDRERLEGLLAEADVLVTNMRLSALRKLDLGPEEVSARYPRLVYGSLTAHGLRGPDAEAPGYDVGAFWARSGLAHQLAQQSPLLAPGAYGDHMTGLSMFSAILAGLLEREFSGSGGIVETSLLQTAAWIVGPDLAVQSTQGKVRPVAARCEVLNPLVNSYLAADGRWFFLICPETVRHLPKVAAAIGQPDLPADPRFVDARSILKNRRDLIAIFDEAFGGRSLADWTGPFAAHDVWWEPVKHPAEVLADPQLDANCWLEDVEVAPALKVPMVTAPMKVFGAIGPRPVRAPALGEHAEQLWCAGSDA